MMLPLALMLAAAPTLGEIEVRLFYERSGRLSPNIAPPARFTAWNTIIGEGDAQEPAQDLVATIAVRSGGAEANTTVPVTLTARNEAGRVLATRTWRSILIGQSGQTVLPLFLANTACGGKITIEAQMGAARKRTTVSMDCGE